MAKNIVYVLGAGFSHPLGLPLISNFIEKMYEYLEDNDNETKFLSDIIDSFSKSGRFYNVNFKNVEEVLSILEFRSFGDEKEILRFQKFKKILIDTINHFTPHFTSTVAKRNPDANWYDHIITNTIHNDYLFFVCGLFNLGAYIHKFSFLDDSGSTSKRELAFREVKAKNNYSVITLNYDCVLEKLIAVINNDFKPYEKFETKFTKDLKKNVDKSENLVYLSKIHGCVEKGYIIPPTSNKTIFDKDIKDEWHLAYEILKNANEIRIIGYSLPLSDSYIKYLFKSTSLDTLRLKNIDVICLDSNEFVKLRYNELLNTNNFRFKNSTTQEYLQFLNITRHPNRNANLIINDYTEVNPFIFNNIEEFHEKFMQL